MGLHSMERTKSRRNAQKKTKQTSQEYERS